MARADLSTPGAGGGAPVTAVTVTYNSQRTVGKALGAMRGAHERGLVECVVVDNASADETVAYVEETEPWVTVLRNAENVGFARACNRAFQRARSPYVLLLNPDAALPTADLERMLRFLEEHPRAGIVGPATRQPDGALQIAGRLPTPLGIVLRAARWRPAGRDRRPIVPGEPPFRTEWLCGAILLVRRQVLDELDGFDPRFFLYFEDDDLCRRALDRGWEIWALGAAVGEHVHAASARETRSLLYLRCIAEHYFESRFHYLVKHHGWLRAALAELSELLLLLAITPLRWLAGRRQTGLLVRLSSPILRRPPV